MTAEERPGISVVIVSYNVREFLDTCLQSVALAAGRFRGTVEVIVFDNDSGDGTVSLLQPRWPEVVWIRSDRNLGFGSGCNRGAAGATQELLLFLNPDTLLGEDTFQVLWDFFREHSDAGAVGCKSLNRDGNLELACKRSFPSPRVAAFKLMGLGSLFPKSRVFGRYNLTYLDENQTHEVDAVSGSFLSLRADLFRQVGGFDEDFFLYGEDLDLCFRVKLLGRRNFYHPATQVIHFKGESAKSRPLRSFFNFYEAMVIFSRKHLELRALPLFFLYAGIVALALVNFVSRRFRRWPRWAADLLIVNALLTGVTFAYQKILGGAYLFYTAHGLHLFWHALASLSVVLPLSYLGEYGRTAAPLKNVFLAACGSFLAFFSFSFFVKEHAYSRVVFAVTAVLSVALLVGWRLLIQRRGRFWRKAPGPGKRTAILGTSLRARQFAESLRTRPADGGLNYEFVGFLQFPAGLAPRETRAHIIGDLEYVRGIARKLDLQCLIIALEEAAYAAAFQILSNRGTGSLEVKLLIGRLDSGRHALVDLDFRK